MYLMFSEHLLSTLANITIGFTQEEYPVTENEGSVRVFLERNNVMLDRDISFTIFTIMGPGEAVGMLCEILSVNWLLVTAQFTYMQ